jgi:DNA helicase-2/ATP-dependent DNA helicase PcrA
LDEFNLPFKSLGNFKIIPAVKEKGILSLSYFQVEDYLTCPLKYRYRHIMCIPVLAHHNLVFGRVLHNTIHFYLKERMLGKGMTEKELLSDSIHFVFQKS